MNQAVANIDCVLVSYNTAGLLHECFANLTLASRNLHVRTFVVDNASRDSSVDILRSDFPDYKLIANSKNIGFGRANNQSLEYLQGQYVLLLNTDAFVGPEALIKTINYMDLNPKCGILGVRLEGRDGALQPCCRYFPTPWNTFLQRTGLSRVLKRVQMVDDMTWAHDEVRMCDWVVGCYYLVRKEVIDQIGLFDPRYFLYFEEVDHCFAAKKAGWDVVFYPHTTVVHLGGESAKSEGAITEGGKQLEALQVESELLYYRKNYGLAVVWASVVLTWLAEIINGFKRILKPGASANTRETWRRMALVWRSFVQTRWATQPTR
jgi:N-acetylglucosaminyl-diphospho-decaprenol L-rhamnosyltransferase